MSNNDDFQRHSRGFNFSLGRILLERYSMILLRTSPALPRPIPVIMNLHVAQRLDRVLYEDPQAVKLSSELVGPQCFPKYFDCATFSYVLSSSVMTPSDHDAGRRGERRRREIVRTTLNPVLVRN